MRRQAGTMTQRDTTHGYADEARETAAALLAAAAAAEREETP